MTGFEGTMESPTKETPKQRDRTQEDFLRYSENGRHFSNRVEVNKHLGLSGDDEILTNLLLGLRLIGTDKFGRPKVSSSMIFNTKPQSELDRDDEERRRANICISEFIKERYDGGTERSSNIRHAVNELFGNNLYREGNSEDGKISKTKVESLWAREWKPKIAGAQAEMAA